MTGDVPEKDSGTASTESAEQSEPRTLREAYDAAWEKENPEGTGETAEAPPKTEGTEQAEEPEHIRWAKSIDGDFDKTTGKFAEDRILKRAYELNKQNQQTAQLNANLQRLLQHPEIFPNVQRILTGQPPPPPAPAGAPEETEKSEEQILEDFVLERAKKLVAPLQEQNAILLQKYVENEAANTYQALVQEFGQDENGKALYDTVRDQVGQQFAATAAQMRMTPQQLTAMLATRGMLYDTLATSARNFLFAPLRQKVQTATAQKTETKRMTQLPGRGTAASAVRKPAKAIKSFRDAVEEAEKELGMVGNT